MCQVPFTARKQLFIQARIYIPEGNRCCNDRIIDKMFYQDDIHKIRIVWCSSLVTLHDLSKMLETMRVFADQELLDKIGYFTLSEERINAFTGLIINAITGLIWEKVIELRDMLVSTRKEF